MKDFETRVCLAKNRLIMGTNKPKLPPIAQGAAPINVEPPKLQLFESDKDMFRQARASIRHAEQDPRARTLPRGEGSEGGFRWIKHGSSLDKRTSNLRDALHKFSEAALAGRLSENERLALADEISRHERAIDNLTS